MAVVDINKNFVCNPDRPAVFGDWQYVIRPLNICRGVSIYILQTIKFNFGGLNVNNK